VIVSFEDQAKLIAKRFIQRRDAKAVQRNDGQYILHTTDGKRESPRLPWRGRDVVDHLERRRSYGHYLVDSDDKCKLFAFDIDLEQTGYLPTRYTFEDGPSHFRECDPRLVWSGPLTPRCQPWMIYQFRMIAEKLAGIAQKELEIPTAVAYSGFKGVHVYCFTGPISASDAYDGAKLVLETSGEFELVRGNNFFKHRDKDPEDGYPNLSIETFPKQGSLDGKDLGNLMRLPLGENRKAHQQAVSPMFLDFSAPPNEFRPLDLFDALTAADPWAGTR
jgi:hypothetical protein